MLPGETSRRLGEQGWARVKTQTGPCRGCFRLNPQGSVSFTSETSQRVSGHCTDTVIYTRSETEISPTSKLRKKDHPEPVGLLSLTYTEAVRRMMRSSGHDGVNGCSCSCAPGLHGGGLHLAAGDLRALHEGRGLVIQRSRLAIF